MHEITSQLPPQPTFEETTFSRAAQLLADPLTDSTRKRQSLLLLLSILSLALFFGIAVPEKISLGSVDMKIATPLTSSGAPSTSLPSIATSALRFNKVLCPVLVYAVLTFWLSVYRDHKTAKYLSELAKFELQRVANQEYTAAHERNKELSSVRERFQNLIAKRLEASEAIQRKSGEITDEFARRIGPIRQSHATALLEFEKIRKEGAPRNQELESKMMELGAQISVLIKKHGEDLRPLDDEFGALMRDTEYIEVEKRMDNLTDEIFGLSGKLVEKTSILADLNVVVRRWRKLWYLLEVGFPSVVGLVAIFVPIRRF